MAHTSASSIQKSFKYDVFLSFSGEDTRKNFVDHLYHALDQKGIRTYKDDERIQKGERISDELIKAIEESKIHIIVFSKNYASSSWCLEELEKIMECQKMTEHTAYPIFYDVEPSHVRHQRGAVGEVFARHVEKKAAGRWREALKEAGSLAGWELKTPFDGHEAKFIQTIVQEISLDLHFITPSFDGKLVGMETRVKNIVSSLEIDSDDVRMIGITGMGGGGKTTLARAVFNHLSIWFEGVSFVENVREVSKSSLSGLKQLQKQVLSDVSNNSINVQSVDFGKSLMKRSRKALVVLDDVDDIDQLKALAGELTWFKPGSRIIITTRDEQVLVAHGVRIHNIHCVNLLSDEEALCLLSRYAFGREIPNQGYEGLSRMIVHYAAGLPLTIKVLGSLLCGRTEPEWVDTIERLKTIPLKETLKTLELSFQDLEDDQKELFLDVVCLLDGETKKKAIRMLESRGFHAIMGLRVLEQKNLITISNTELLCLHHHVKEMGMNIVRRLHPDEPSRHSRLWIKEEIEDILINDLGTEATKCLKLEDSNLHPDIIMKGLRKMSKLNFLYVDDKHQKWKIYEVGQYLPNSLQSVYWHGYPFRCLPKAFQANMLVNLEMPHSSIYQLWEGGERKVLNKLKFLDLIFSRLKTFDLGLAPHLERLDLRGCIDFVDLHMPVECLQLKYLDLSGSKVSNLNLSQIPHLERLDLRGCGDFVELHMPVECSQLKYLDLGGSKVSTLDLGLTPHLERLDLKGCNDFVKLWMPVECPNLKYLDLSGSKVSNFDLGLTPHLERLGLKGCNDFVKLCMSVECPKLKYLNLSGSKVSNLSLGLTSHLERLDLRGCNDFVELHIPVECPNLKYLDLGVSKVSNLSLALTPHLVRLDLRGCNDFVELHMPDECPQLKYLDLSGSKVSNLNIGLAPHLERLDLSRCNDFVNLHLSIKCPKLKYLNLGGSMVTNLNLGLTPRLERLDLRGCNEFLELHMPVQCLNLKCLDLSGSMLSNLDLGLTPHLERLNLRGCNDFVILHIPIKCPELKYLCLCGSKVSNLNLGLTPRLEWLDLRGCNDFVKLHLPVECAKLKYLDLGGSKVSSLNLGLTPHLERLDLRGCSYFVELNMPIKCPKLIYLDLSGSMLSNLNIGLTPDLVALDLSRCNDFVELRMPVQCRKLKFLSLGGSNLSKLNLELTRHLKRLESLERLTLSIEDTKHLPDSICMLKHLKSLELKSCFLLEQLPEDLDKLQCLEKLHLSDCISLRDIPNNVCNMKCLKYLHLPYCILLKSLPDELGRLKSLKELNMVGTGINYLPPSIFQLRDLCIVWSTGRLEWHGFRYLKKISKYTASSYVRSCE